MQITTPVSLTVPTRQTETMADSQLRSGALSVLIPLPHMLWKGSSMVLWLSWAAHAFFPKKVQALLDSSEIESTEQCEGCGKVTKEKAPELRRRKGRIRKVLETVFGFKIWVVWDPNSRLPFAMRFATIEVAKKQAYGSSEKRSNRKMEINS
jgi:hypothetical protein